MKPDKLENESPRPSWEITVVPRWPWSSLRWTHIEETAKLTLNAEISAFSSPTALHHQKKYGTPTWACSGLYTRDIKPAHAYGRRVPRGGLRCQTPNLSLSLSNSRSRSRPVCWSSIATGSFATPWASG